MYRLRKAVGQNVILYENDLYCFNHNLDYEYDVEAFEKFLSNAKKSQNTKQKIDFYQKAIDIMQGPYLNDVFAEWATNDRESLGQSYLKALIELADLYQTDGQPENAIRSFEKIIVADPGNERAYRIAMQAYYRLQDRAAIIRVYQACKEAVKKTFGLEVSRETEELYKRLTK
jgi:LuxR family maltose regulon positive regulatory protein